MSSITFDFRGVEEFVDPGVGLYDVEVKSAKQDASRNGKPRIHLILSIQNNEQWEGGLLSYDIYTSPESRAFAKQALVALGLYEPQDLREAQIRLNIADLEGCCAVAVVEAQTNPNTGALVNRVTRLIPRQSKSAGGAPAPVPPATSARKRSGGRKAAGAVASEPASPEVDEAVAEMFEDGEEELKF
jgi:hypothetical protein